MNIFDNRLAKPMLIASESAPFDSEDYVFELKLGGERVIAYVDRETDLVTAGNRRLLPQFPELARLHEQVGRRCILDGELVVGAASPQDTRLLKKRIRTRQPGARQNLSKQYPSMFVALDVLYLDNSLITHFPLTERRELLQSLVQDSERMCAVRSVEYRGMDLHRIIQERGLQGVIAKRKDSPYRMGERTNDWVEFTHWQEADFVICGYIPDDEHACLVLGQYTHSGVLVHKGRVAIGYDKVEMNIVENQPLAARHPFAKSPLEHSLHTVWIQPRLVCTVGYTDWTVEKQPCNPVFITLSPHKLPYAAAEPA